MSRFIAATSGVALIKWVRPNVQPLDKVSRVDDKQVRKFVHGLTILSNLKMAVVGHD